MNIMPTFFAVLIELLLFSTGNVRFAEQIVPQSTSPNDKYALTFEPPISQRSDDPPEVWFVKRPSRRHISAQLVPSFRDIFTTKLVNGVAMRVCENDAQHKSDAPRQMYECLVAGAQAMLTFAFQDGQFVQTKESFLP